MKKPIYRLLSAFYAVLTKYFSLISLFKGMKFFHLLPILFLSLNFAGIPLHKKPEAAAGKRTGTTRIIDVAETDKIIPWKIRRSLVWDDFRSEPKKEGDAVASTSTSLGLSYQVRDGRLTYHVTCDFSKEKSWGSLRTNYILAHEQAHFDITELYARKLHETLSYYQFNPVTYKADISTIYNRIVKEKEDMQEAYDGQTDHSRKTTRQLEWLEKIEKLLMDTHLFAAYP